MRDATIPLTSEALARPSLAAADGFVCGRTSPADGDVCGRTSPAGQDYVQPPARDLLRLLYRQMRVLAGPPCLGPL